jgi:hypothetical protein
MNDRELIKVLYARMERLELAILRLHDRKPVQALMRQIDHEMWLNERGQTHEVPLADRVPTDEELEAAKGPRG